jgi:hypothetical protein
MTLPVSLTKTPGVGLGLKELLFKRAVPGELDLGFSLEEGDLDLPKPRIPAVELCLPLSPDSIGATSFPCIMDAIAELPPIFLPPRVFLFGSAGPDTVLVMSNWSCPYGEEACLPKSGVFDDASDDALCTPATGDMDGEAPADLLVGPVGLMGSSIALCNGALRSGGETG